MFHGFFRASSGLAAFVPLCHYRDISPGRIYVSDVWSLALAQNSRRLPSTTFCASFGPPGFVPICLWRDFSPGRIYVSDVWSLARSQNSRRLPRPPFSANSGLPASLPSVTGVTSPQGEYTSPTFDRSHSHRTAEDSLDHFSVRARASRLRSPLSLS